MKLIYSESLADLAKRTHDCLYLELITTIYPKAITLDDEELMPTN